MRHLRYSSIRSHIVLFSLAFALALGCDGDKGDTGETGETGPAGPSGEQGPPGDPTEPTAAIEGCIGCHAVNAAVPVGDITSLGDAHYVDTDPFGPLTAAGHQNWRARASRDKPGGENPRPIV